MPWPQQMKANESDFKITEEFIVFIHGEENEYGRISKAAVRFIRYMTDKTGVFVINGFPNPKGIDASAASLHIYFDNEVEVAMGIDESYNLQVTDNVIEIRAKTDVGAMHGLSSLLQLIEIKNGSYAFAGVEINDEPRFVWRGLMMDVARHFMPIDVVKRNIDAMALVKLNVFHWHLSDDQGFRVETKTLPELYQKASDGLYYTKSDVKEIVKYANDRGIRVVPEFDVPGHGTAFLTAFPELGSKKDMEYSVERNSGIFDPTLDPTNEKTYEFLDALFKEVAPLFNDVYFHIGGDENEGKHWDENIDIQQFMKENELKDNHELQTYFNIRLEKILAKYGKSLMGWEEIMTANMPKTALIHSWRGVNEGMQPGESLVKAVKNGYQTILSNGYYIDLLLSVEDHYLVDPMPDVELTEVEAKRILGGEATMWAELVTPLTVDSRIWPRTAAIAERFWSAQEVRDIDHMYDRLSTISQFLELMGIQHLKSKEYILRNIANYQDTHGLRSLTYISEPFKIYSRNAGGTEYKTYSPFTLFADACTADAKSVRDFRQLVDNYIKNPNESLKKELDDHLKTWEGISDQLKIIEPDAPLVSRLIPYAERVGEIAAIIAKVLNSNVISSEELKQLKSLVEKKEDPTVNLDVELAVANDIMRLAEYLAKN
ncbi:MAG: family 20 glycosylhydrolase [Flavobacteriales bacterium]|nr:family 20 glycosylhydrolase [Flavobacteriales bacterium]